MIMGKIARLKGMIIDGIPHVNKTHMIMTIVLALSIFFVSCTGAAPEEDHAHETDEPHTHEEEIIHTHTITFDPTSGNLYIGTHQALEQYDGEKTVQASEAGIDFMSFTITSDGTFFASGHSEKTGNLGIVMSTDKGKTWEQSGYKNLDFHDMSASYANANVIYARATPPDEFLTVSTDKGETWNKRDSQLQAIVFSLAADHQEESTVYMGTLNGLYVSDNYGETWEQLPSLTRMSVIAIADDPIDAGTMYVSANAQGVMKTTDNGETWVAINDGLPQGSDTVVLLMAVHPLDSTLYAVVKNEGFYIYDGESWSVVDIS